MKNIFWLCICFLLVGCTNTPQTPIAKSSSPIPTSFTLPAATPTLQVTPIQDLRPYIEEREIVLMDMGIAKSELGTAGELFEMNLQNGSIDPRSVDVPCGTTFLPVLDDKYQTFVTIQPLKFSLEPLGWIILHPMVICIEPDKITPTFGEQYTVGGIAEDEVFNLSQCICKTQIDPADVTTLLSIQISFWFLTQGIYSKDVDTLSDEAILEILQSKNIDTETLNTVSSFLPFLRSAVKTRLSDCGY